MIVTFSGVDCAGKSTQIARLRESLAARGHDPRVVWFRPGYSPELDALRRLVRRLRPGALPSADQPADRARAFSRPGVRGTWIAMAVGDTLLQYALKLRADHLLGRSLICDRWLDDAALDLRLRFPELAPRVDPGLRAVRALCPTPDASFLLMLPHAEMLRRMDVKQEPFPDAPEIRDRRFSAYATLAASGRFHVLDAARSIEAIHSEILATLRLEG
jgi:thymidylate kinase